MKVYISHSKAFDYIHELYEPLKESAFGKKNQLVFPHEEGQPRIKSKEIIESCDLMIVDVSFSSISVGIEVGWADAKGIPIIAVYQQEFQPPGSILLVAKKVISYSDPEELGEKVEDALQKLV